MSLNLHLWAIDINSVFLYSNIEKDVYIKQPTGFAKPEKENHVWHLKKVLYGLRQTPKAFWDDLVTHICQFNFVPLESEPVIFIWLEDNEYSFIDTHVDDLTGLSSSVQEEKQCIEQISLRYKYKTTNTDKSCTILGMQLECDQQTGSIRLHHKKYINSILEHFNVMEDNPIQMPMNPFNIVSKNICPRLN